MRFKPVPEPPADLEAVASILAAVPETAGAIDDCCAHLVAETRLEAREKAETWLVFLRALELATEDADGYRRIPSRPSLDDTLEPAPLQRPFRERVYGADTVLRTLERAAEPLSAAAVTDAARDRSAADRERNGRLLEWAVLLGLAERAADGERYRVADDLE